VYAGTFLGKIGPVFKSGASQRIQFYSSAAVKPSPISESKLVKSVKYLTIYNAAPVLRQVRVKLPRS
jgi:hypothetical protein